MMSLQDVFNESEIIDFFNRVDKESPNTEYICELKKFRLERRSIKNDITVMQKFNEQKNKMLSTTNRKFLMNEIYKTEKQLHTPYKNRQYKDGEIDDILSKRKNDI